MLSLLFSTNGLIAIATVILLYSKGWRGVSLVPWVVLSSFLGPIPFIVALFLKRSGSLQDARSRLGRPAPNDSTIHVPGWLTKVLAILVAAYTLSIVIVVAVMASDSGTEEANKSSEVILGVGILLVLAVLVRAFAPAASRHSDVRDDSELTPAATPPSRERKHPSYDPDELRRLIRFSLWGLIFPLIITTVFWWLRNH